MSSSVSGLWSVPAEVNATPARAPAAVEVALDTRSAFVQHHDAVWRTLAALGVPPAIRDDAVQDVFVIVQRRRCDYDGRAPVRAWILGIARNVARSHRRGWARFFDPLERLALPLRSAPAQERAVAAAQATRLVEQGLEALSVPQREVFVLIELEGCTAPEVAASLGVKLNTVYSRLRLGRRKFEQALRCAKEKL